MDQASTSPRPRSRGFSFRSDKSGGSKTREDLTESPADKKRRDSIWKLTSKANPNAALSEQQPGALAASETNTLQLLRDAQHKDVNGIPIAEPDLANPTRPRWERPLDTIRSFEKAIDSGYKRRSSMIRAESWDQNNQFASRRSSYFGGYDNGPSPNRHSQVGGGGGYYGSRNSFAAQEAPPSRNRYGQRMQSDSGMRYSNGQTVYPQHGYHQSHDTVNTGMTNGSDSTGPWANSTDPSSENSSIDKVNAPAKPTTPGDPYGQNGYGGPSQFQGPIMEEYGPGSNGGAYPQGSRQPKGYGPRTNGPPPAASNGQNVRKPIPLGGPSSQPALPTMTRPEPEKKKGFFKRTFSKKEK